MANGLLFRVYKGISRRRGAVHLTPRAFRTVGPARAFGAVLFGASRRRGGGAYNPSRGVQPFSIRRRR